MFELPRVLRLIVMARRGRDQPAAVDRPCFEANHSYRVSGAARPRVRPREGPVVFDPVAVDDEVIHEHLDVRQGGVETLGRRSAIVEDITERKIAEERLRALFDGTYECLGLLATDGTLLEANRASLDFIGRTREEVIGVPFWETPWFTPTPGATEQVREGVERAAAGEFVRYEIALRRPVGGIATFDFSLHPIRNQNGEVVLIVPEGRDISELKVRQLRDAFLVRLDDATRPLTDPREITQTTARLLGEHLQANRCAYADVEEDEDTFNLIGDYSVEVSSIVGRYTFTQFGEECLRLMREGMPYVVEDSETDPRTSAALPSYRQTQIRSVVCVPLRKAGRFVGAVAVHQATPRKWRPDEIDLVRVVANRCWESLERVHVTRELRER